LVLHVLLSMLFQLGVVLTHHFVITR
jgi:hypothetical protein